MTSDPLVAKLLGHAGLFNSEDLPSRLEPTARGLRQELVSNEKFKEAASKDGAKTIAMTADRSVFRSGWANPLLGESRVAPAEVKKVMFDVGTDLGFSGILDFGNEPYPDNYKAILQYLEAEGKRQRENPNSAPLPQPANFDQFVEHVGNYLASHAERQALVHALAVDSDQSVVEIGLLGPATVCDVNTDHNPAVGCRDFLSDTAKHLNKTIIVAEHIVSRDPPNQILTFHPDGNISEKLGS